MDKMRSHNIVQVISHIKRVSLIIFYWAFLLTCIYGMLSGSAFAQTKWTELSDLDSFTSPAISGHVDGEVYVVAVAGTGIVAYKSTPSPGGWGTWEIIGPQPTGEINDPAFYADRFTPPVLVLEGNMLYLFARGNDDNLYETHHDSGSGWSNWQQLTTDGHVRGRLSVAFTRPETVNPLQPLELYAHIIYKSPNDTVEYRRFLIMPGSWSSTGNAEQLSNSLEGTIGTDGTNQLLGLIRGNDRQLHVYKKLSPWNANWKLLFSLKAEGAQGDFFDISNIVYFGGDFHAVYAIKRLEGDITQYYVHKLEHLRIVKGQSYEYHIITNYNPQVGDRESHPLSTLIDYRNKLVVAYRDPVGWVRYVRWDNADPVLEPWLGTDIIDASHKTNHRPVLDPLNRRPFLAWNEYGNPNFGDDLFAAITESNTYAVLFTNFSRAAFIKEMGRQFTVYNSNSDDQNPVCRNQNESFAPSLISDIGQDGKPFFSELGYTFWTLPDWFGETLFKDAGTIACQEGNASGRFDPNPTCDETKYPVIIISKGRSGICNGVWVHRGASYYGNIFHELVHAMSGMLGFSDNNNEPPTATSESRTGISLSALSSGFALFGKNINSDCVSNEPDDTCPGTRATGFTGGDNNYNASSRQHSFIGTFTYYFQDGDQLRTWIQQDLLNNSNLLQLKYNWIKTYIFQGAEFKKDNEPFVDLIFTGSVIPYPAGQQSFAYDPVDSPVKHINPADAKPVGIGQFASGSGDTLTVRVSLEQFVGAVDIYGAYTVSTDPAHAYLLNPDSATFTQFMVTDINEALIKGIPPPEAQPWRSFVTFPIDEVIVNMQVSSLTSGTYTLYLLVTKTEFVIIPGDQAESLHDYYLWSTSFVVP